MKLDLMATLSPSAKGIAAADKFALRGCVSFVDCSRDSRARHTWDAGADGGIAIESDSFAARTGAFSAHCETLHATVDTRWKTGGQFARVSGTHVCRRRHAGSDARNRHGGVQVRLIATCHTEISTNCWVTGSYGFVGALRGACASIVPVRSK